jgi:DNA-binding PadR family transcriptional regulator
MSAGVQEKRAAVESPLRGALLALLVSEGEIPHGGYRLGTLLERRLPSAWRVTRPSVYLTLERLEADGLACSMSRSGATSDRRQRLYSATERTAAALAAWMESPVVRGPVRVEIQARIAVSSPQHAPMLLRALDAYERECFAMLKETEDAEVPMGSWTGLTMNLTRLAVDGTLQAELSWIAVARRWIENFTAEQTNSRSR